MHILKFPGIAVNFLPTLAVKGLEFRIKIFFVSTTREI